MLWTCEIIGSTFNCKLNSGPTYIHWRPRILSKVYLLEYSRMIRSLSVSHCLPGAFCPAGSLSSPATLP